MTRRVLLGRLRDLALTVTALVGAVCLVLVIAGLALGVHPLLFRSGSMAPAIDTGDLALARTVDATSLRQGDIVSVIGTGGQRVTHRVVGTLEQSGGIAQLQLKGDANKTPDTQVYDVKKAERVFLRIPKAGYVVAWFSHAPGSYVLAGYVALMLLLVLRRRPSGGGAAAEAIAPEAPPAPEPAIARTMPAEQSATDPGSVPRRPLKAAAIAGCLALGLVALAGWGQNTGASWTDQATVTGTSFTVGTWGPPAPTFGASPCTGGGKFDVTFEWNAVVGAASYVVTITPSGGSAQTIPVASGTTYTYTGNNAQVSGTFTVQAVSGSGATGASSVQLNFTTGNGSGKFWACS